MICVLKQEFKGQFHLFLDYEKLNIVEYGTILQIKEYFIKEGIFFDLTTSDISNTGFDYLVDLKYMYIIINLDKTLKKNGNYFFIYDELGGIDTAVSYIKSYIRNEKLKKLEI